jgi:hypothetical protein
VPIDPLSTTALSGIGAWGWDKYGKTLTDKTADTVKGRWDKFKWKDAAERYRAKIKKLYGTIQIMGITESVQLDDIFTEVYMLDKPTAFGRFDIERLKQLSANPDAKPKIKPIGGLTLVNRNKNLFILGKPGAGKTTFLKYIAVQAAEPKKPLINKVPIFISLKQWADSGMELMSFIAERFDICGFPAAQPFVEELLKSGSAIVLFDSLDEVNQENGQRDKQTRAMNDFIEKYDRTQYLITCRLAASDYSFKHFTYVEIVDFGEREIRRFIINWFKSDTNIRDRFLTEFGKEENKGLRDLARTPLLLTLLCLAFNETLTFPQRRVEIYEEAVGALLKKWDSSRRIKRDEVYRKLSLGHKENMLARIAAETFERDEYFIQQPELERKITDYIKNVPPHDTSEAADGEIILKAIEAQQGILVERARKVYSFSHLTLQEYFTAKHIVANATKATLTNLIKLHCADERWHEVFLLITSLLPDASQFMQLLQHRLDELLAGDNKLIGLLKWADRKSAILQTNAWLIRQSYLFISLFSTDSPVLTRVSDPSMSIDLSLARDLDTDVELDLSLSLSLSPNLTRDLDRALARAITSDIDQDFDKVRVVTQYMERARTLAREMDLIQLERELLSLFVPNNDANELGWQQFTEKLSAVMMKHRDIGPELDLTNLQAARLADYINATRLLKDCLELAFMMPDEKKAMQESLYLPPAQGGKGGALKATR